MNPPKPLHKAVPGRQDAMPRCMAALSANAGISLVLGRTRIWIDALHNRAVPGFSSLSPSLWARVKEHPAFAPPDMICFTHCHQDHYDRRLVQEAHALWPQARLVLPEPEFDGQILLSRPLVKLCLQGIELQFFRLPHAGREYARIPHYGLLAAWEGFHILVPGDCAVPSAELKAALNNRAVDLAIMDFPWLTLPQGQAFLREVIRPRHLLICHLPFVEDDRFGYCKAANWAMRKMSEEFDVRLLQAPLQTELI